jgi:hypothetical protein
MRSASRCRIWTSTGDDILVGNDFNVQDAAWRWTGSNSRRQPFATTTEDTMSLAEGDIDNDGRLELFATDMKPYALDVHTLALWLPVMDKMPKQKALTDPQVIANVLQVRDANDIYRDQAVTRGVSSTGWSWSGKFGDLDNDGYLDLYVVNGMIDGQTLGHLPGHELVEENQALRNGGDGTFAPARGWGLGATEAGAGWRWGTSTTTADWTSSSTTWRRARACSRTACAVGSDLQVDLRWADSANTRALGARLALVTDRGTFRRTSLPAVATCRATQRASSSDPGDATAPGSTSSGPTAAAHRSTRPPSDNDSSSRGAAHDLESPAGERSLPVARAAPPARRDAPADRDDRGRPGVRAWSPRAAWDGHCGAQWPLASCSC